MGYKMKRFMFKGLKVRFLKEKINDLKMTESMCKTFILTWL